MDSMYDELLQRMVTEQDVLSTYSPPVVSAAVDPFYSQSYMKRLMDLGGPLLYNGAIAPVEYQRIQPTAEELAALSSPQTQPQTTVTVTSGTQPTTTMTPTTIASAAPTAPIAPTSSVDPNSFFPLTAAAAAPVFNPAVIDETFWAGYSLTPKQSSFGVL